ncbi:MAG: cyanophycin synthetase, partial [Ruthenibacterium sp.]
IFKNHCDVVAYPLQPQAAMDEIVLRAAAAKCALTVPEMEDLHVYRAPAFENRVDYGGYDLNIPFPGIHQACNAMVVVEAALRLCDHGFTISDEAIMDGIAKARFPARIEVLHQNPLVLLDGAHNPDGARALADTLKAANVHHLTAVIGVLNGKNPEEMLTALSPCFEEVLTVTPQSPRAMSAAALAALAKKHFAKVTACDSVSAAIAKAKQNIDGGIVVCGSLYLAAEARKILKP